MEAGDGRPSLILIGTGSELHLCTGAREQLEKKGVPTRVVSMPSWEIFEAQPEEYRMTVFPSDVNARLSVEAGATLAWCKWVGDKGASIGIDRFGASAPAAEIAAHLGLTVENVVNQALKLVGV
jgi:transketolase